MATARAGTDSDIVRWGGGFILVVLTMIALIGLAMAIRDVTHWARVDDWVETRATITKTRIAENIGTSDARRHRPLVEFAYDVDDQRYTGSNGEWVGEMTRAEAEAVIAAHRKGTEISVWYDPNDVDDATLERDPPFMRGQTLGFLLPSVAYWVYFGGWLVPAWRANRRARRLGQPAHLRRNEPSST